MAGTVFTQAEIDQELVELVRRSVSLNAMEKTDREKVILRIFTFPLDKQLEIKDMLIHEQEDMAKASTDKMYADYMKLKEVYSNLKAEKTTLEGKLRVVREHNSEKADAAELTKLEKELQTEDEDDDGEIALPHYP